MKHKIEFDCKCDSCKATGIYTGLGERDSFGVVCHSCKGTGKVHRIIKYEDFNGRRRKKGLKRVLKVNPGICCGTGGDLTLESFGGMPYKDWFQGKPFPLGSEMRHFTCPAWWYQSADYEKKPRWDWCRGFCAFADCLRFPTKEECWERWDSENV